MDDAVSMALALKNAAEKSGLSVAEISACLPQNSSAPFTLPAQVADENGGEAPQNETGV